MATFAIIRGNRDQYLDHFGEHNLYTYVFFFPGVIMSFGLG